MRKKEYKSEISVIIPVYNGENYLKRTLNCLSAQVFTSFEIIFVNDGSTDRTGQILETFKKQTNIPTTIVTQKNKGPGAARNAGLAQAQGRYISLLDADDIYEPEFLEKLHKRAISTGADVTVCRADEFWPELNRKVETPWTINEHLIPKKKRNGGSDEVAVDTFSSADIPKNFFEVFVGWTWDKLFKADYIKDIGLKFQELRSSDDAFFCFMALIRAKKLTIVDDILVHHVKYSPIDTMGRDDSGAPFARKIRIQSVSNSREGSWDNFHKALLAIKKQMEKWGIYKRFEQDYVNYFLNFSLWHLTTLTGSAYFQLYDKLKKSWFKATLGANLNPDYFYSKHHYDFYLHLMQMDANEFLFYNLQRKEQKTCDLEWHIQNLGRDLKSERQRIHNLENDIDIRQARIHELEKEIADIKNSTAWKVGRYITVVPRKIKTAINKK